MPKGEDRASYVRRWLKEQGYPLEMRVADALRRAGFRVRQSAYFSDPDENKPRELDVVASYVWDAAAISWELVVLVECKSAAEPWVLFTAPSEAGANASYHYWRVAASKVGRQLLTRLSRHGSKKNAPALALPKRPAYGLRQARK